MDPSEKSPSACRENNKYFPAQLRFLAIDFPSQNPMLSYVLGTLPLPLLKSHVVPPFELFPYPPKKHHQSTGAALDLRRLLAQAAKAALNLLDLEDPKTRKLAAQPLATRLGLADSG